MNWTSIQIIRSTDGTIVYSIQMVNGRWKAGEVPDVVDPLDYVMGIARKG